MSVSRTHTEVNARFPSRSDTSNEVLKGSKIFTMESMMMICDTCEQITTRYTN